MKFRITLSLFPILFLVSQTFAFKADNHSTFTKSVHLSGKVKDPITYELKLKFKKDPITSEVQELTVPVSVNGNFDITFNLGEDASLVHLEYNMNSYEVYVENREHLKLYFEGKNFPYSLTFEGSRSKHNTFLKSYRQRFEKFTDNFIQYELSNRSAMDYFNFISNIHQQKKRFYDSYDYEHKKSFTKAFQNYIFADIEYWKAYNLIRYKWEYPSYNGLSSNYRLPVPYHNYLSSVNINNENALSNPYYQYFVRFYLKYREENPAKVTRKIAVQKNILKRVPVVDVDNIKIRKNPINPAPVTLLNKGYELIYLNEESPNKYTYTIQNTNKTEPFFKVQTLDGLVGWIFGGGVRWEEKIETKTVYETIEVDGEKNDDKFKQSVLKGKVHYFVLANEMYNRCMSEPTRQIKKDINRFLRMNPYRQYDDVVQNAFTAAEHKELGVYTASNSILSQSTPVKRTTVPSSMKVVKPIKEELPKYSTALPSVKKNTDDIVITQSKAIPKKEVITEAMPKVTPSTVEKKEISKITTPTVRTQTKTQIQKNTQTQRKTTVPKATTSKIVASTPVTNGMPKVEPNNSTQPSVVTTQPIVKKEPTKKVIHGPQRPIGSPNQPSRIIVDPKLKERERASGISADILKELDNAAKYNVDTQSTTRTTQQTTTTTQIRTTTVNSSGVTQNAYVEIDARPEVRPTIGTAFRGSVENHRGYQLKLIIYKNPINYEEKVYNLHLKKEGYFTTKLYLTEPVSGKLVYGGNKVDVFLEPGDDLSIYFDGTKFMESLYFSGQGSNHNNFLKQLNKQFKKEDKTIRRKVEYAKIGDFKKAVEEIYEAKKQLFAQISGQRPFSSKFYEYAKAEIDYWYAYELINYPWEHPIYKDQEAPMSVPKNYYNFMDRVNSSAYGALPSKHYTNFLYVFFDDKAREPENFGLTKAEIASKYLSGEALEYMKAKELVLECQRGRAGEMGYEILSFLDQASYPVYKDVVKMVYNETKGLLIGKPAPEFNLVDAEGNEAKLSDFRGKVVYIDFWATWCQYCINDFPNARKLKEDYEGKDIVFLYVNMDESKKTWENFVKNVHIGGKQLYADGGMSSDIAKLYGAKRLPYCVIIDKDGNVAQSPAKRPSQPGVKSQINQLLY